MSILDDSLDDLLNSGRAFIADEKPTIQIKGNMEWKVNVTNLRTILG